MSKKEEVLAFLKTADAPVKAADVFDACKCFGHVRDASKYMYDLHKYGHVGRAIGECGKPFYSIDPAFGEWATMARGNRHGGDAETVEAVKSIEAIINKPAAVEPVKLAVVNNELAKENELLRRKIEELSTEIAKNETLQRELEKMTEEFMNLSLVSAEQEAALEISAGLIEDAGGRDFDGYVIRSDGEPMQSLSLPTLDGAKAEAVKLANERPSVSFDVCGLVSVGRVELVPQWVVS